MTTLTCALTILLAASAEPTKIFPERITVGARPLVRNGYGLCEWGFFGIDLYWAALYVETPGTTPEQILDAVRQLRQHAAYGLADIIGGVG